jgi:hypothetical protein
MMNLDGESYQQHALTVANGAAAERSVGENLVPKTDGKVRSDAAA